MSMLVLNNHLNRKQQVQTDSLMNDLTDETFSIRPVSRRQETARTCKHDDLNEKRHPIRSASTPPNPASNISRCVRPLISTTKPPLNGDGWRTAARNLHGPPALAK